MRNVIVSGGSRGIGLSIARRLSASGFQVIVVARGSGEALSAAMAEATAACGGPIQLAPADLADTDRISDLVRQIRRQFGPIYGLVNNAGIGTVGLLATMPNAQVEQLVRINTLAPILLTKYAVRDMMANGAGRIVNVSSIVASTGYNALSVYSATKASMVGFTRSLAREVGKLGITVNAVAPGFIDTELTSSLAGSDRDRIKRRSALQRLPEAEDVANTVDFLFGSGGRNITGTVMTVDAGSTA